MTIDRRTLVKGIGTATIALPFLGKVGAAESAQFIVTGNGNASQRIEQAGFHIQRELADGRLLQVQGPESARSDLEKIGSVNHVVANAYFGLEGAEVVEAVDSEEFEPPAFWGSQWDKHLTGVVPAHQRATGAGATIAVLDTGIDPGHPDLSENVNIEDSELFSSGDPIDADAHPWDLHGHGTHVAGTAAATGDVGVIGTAPDAELLSLKVFWFEEHPDEEDELILTTTPGDILAAIDAAAALGADVANLSLGTPPLPPEFNSTGMRVAYERVIHHATNQGTAVVASAGNDAANLQQGGYFTTPNSTAGAISVSASAPNDELSFYSNFGTNEIDVGAPGGGYETLDKTLEEDPTEVAWPYPLNLVLSTVPGGSWAWMAGTSMAAPQVAGAVALVRELDPDANANQVESAIKHGAVGSNGQSDSELGAGRLDVARTVEWVDN